MSIFKKKVAECAKPDEAHARVNASLDAANAKMKEALRQLEAKVAARIAPLKLVK